MSNNTSNFSPAVVNQVLTEILTEGIDWVVHQVLIECQLRVSIKTQTAVIFSTHDLEMYIIPLKVHIYLLELNSRLVASVFSFCLPCLKEGKWPFDRIYLLLECIIFIARLPPILSLSVPIYTPGWRKAPRTQHNVPSQGQWTRITRSRAKRTNHEATTLPTMHILI